MTVPQFRLYCYREPLCGCVCLIIALLWLMSLLFAGTKQWFAEPKQSFAGTKQSFAGTKQWRHCLKLTE